MVARFMPRRRASLLAALLCALLTSPAAALDFGAGPSPRAYEKDKPFSVAGDEAIIIEGVNSGAKATNIILRIDDEWAPSADQRFEKSFKVEPGPFSVIVPIKKLVAKDGGALSLEKLTRVVLFAWDDAQIKITRFGSGAAAVAKSPPPVEPPKTAVKAAPKSAPAAAAPAPAVGGEVGVDMMRPRPLPILFEPTKPADFSAAGEIVIEGVYRGAAKTVLVLRVDDSEAPTYGKRFNGEYAVSPGPFQIVVPVNALKTPAARMLDLKQIWRVILSSEDDRNFEISRLETTRSRAMAPVPAKEIKKAEAPKPIAPAPREGVKKKRIDFGKGKAPIEHGYYFTKLDLSGYDEIVVEGTAKTKGGLWLILRIDDGKSSGYATRYNLEIELTEGPFKIRAPLGGLKSPSGRLIDPSDIKLLVAAPYGDKKGEIEISRFVARKAPRLPKGAIGYAFGSPDAGLPPGFERIGPKDPRVFGSPTIVARPMPDPLVANGLRGVKTVRLAAPAGAYRVTIWSEDPGEWEYLPHPLRRVIRVNGVDLRNDKLTRQDWLASRYLKGLAREHTPKDDAYSAYGALRGEPRSAKVIVKGDEGLRVELGGSGPAARYISALLIEPAGDDAAFKAVEAARADWYREYWRVDPKWREIAAKDSPRAARLSLRSDAPQLTDAAGAPIKALKAVGAPGSGLRLTLSARAEAKIDAKARLTAPKLGKTALKASLWTGQWRLERRRPEHTLLRLGDNTLLPMGDAPIPADRPRRYEMWFEAPKDAKPGVYKGAFEITTATGVIKLPIEIELLPVKLPEAKEPAGFYISEAPHMTWFASKPFDRQRQAACDVRFVKRFGLLGSAPAVRSPKVGSTLATVLDLRLAFDLGLAPSPLAYNPIRPLQFDYKPKDGARLIADIEAQLKAAGAPPPYWSVADELSNPGETAAKDFWPWVKALRAAAPGIKLAGHLNSPDDRAFLSGFDAVVLNTGFGIDAKTLHEMKRRGLKVWIYNTFEPRLTAGSGSGRRMRAAMSNGTPAFPPLIRSILSTVAKAMCRRSSRAPKSAQSNLACIATFCGWLRAWLISAGCFGWTGEKDRRPKR